MSSLFFLDSSVIVKCYLNETGSRWIRNLVQQPSVRLFSVRIAQVEVVSAIVRRRKSNALSEEDAKLVIDQFRRDFADYFATSEVTSPLISLASVLSERHALRAYDAVQLAAAIEANEDRHFKHLPPLTFLCSDRILNEAALREGLLVDDPNDHS